MSLVPFGNANWTSPHVLSCFVTLRAKGLPFEVKSISLHDGGQHEASFARQSLTSRVLKTGFDLTQRLRGYAETQWARPAVKEFCDHVRPPFRRGPYP